MLDRDLLKKISSPLWALVSILLGCWSAYNGAVIEQQAAMAGPDEVVRSLWSAWTTVPGLSSVGTFVYSVFLHWRNTNPKVIAVEKSARDLALQALGMECLVNNDLEGLQKVGGLITHFKERDAVKVDPNAHL